ncbi:hypothetical protein WG219_11780 [Ectopseudomonas mendocina]|uniref:HEPN AbiU2-like domain-containing protein n=1 Tax=Ectopseudomonas mendocina TaxID=300 RepID=A0ABZ2RDF5_ECTME
MLFDEEELKRRADYMAENGGIQPMHGVFYNYSIRYTAECALNAFLLYEELLECDSEAWELVSSVQEAIGHAGALSRYFWPPVKPKDNSPFARHKTARGASLRKHYGLTEDSPLCMEGLRKARNAWEHFDERLDVYLLKHLAGEFIPEPLVASHALADSPVKKVFKLIDPEAQCLVLLGEKFFFGPIRDEVIRILSHFSEYKNLSDRLIGHREVVGKGGLEPG